MSRSTVLHIILIVVAAAAVYANSLGGDFVYDDKAMIVAYDLVKDISNVPKAFTSATTLYGNVNYYRPLQTITYMTDYFLWGRVSAGFHFTNVLFHILAALAVYVFITVLFKNKILALVTALLFAVHPVHTGVVSYIAGRADAMLCVFMLACFVFYVRFRYGDAKRADHIFSVVFFVLALLVKELAMIILLVIVLFDKYGWRWTALTEKRKANSDYIPFLAVLGAYLLFRFTRMSFFVEGAVPPFPFVNRLITAPYALAQYLRLMVLPNDLHMGREPWVAGSILDGRILFSMIVIALFFYCAWRVKNKNSKVLFGASFFLIMIFPSLNIITPLFYTVAENWMYIPSIGLFLIIASIVQMLYDRSAASGKTLAKCAVVTCCVFFIIAMGAVTVSHNRTWKDEITLGANTLRFNPREFKIYNNMGVVYLGRRDLDKAEESFWKCLEIKPDTGMAYFNLYRVYIARSNRKQAVQYLNKARQLDADRVNILVEKMNIKD